MKLTNCYIFINNHNIKEDNKKKNEETIYVKVNTESVRYRLKKIFNLSKSDRESLFSYSYHFEENECEIELKIQEVSEATYLTISSSGNTKKEIIKSLESIQKKIIDSDIEKHFVMIISFDSVSEYYCNMLYPMLNELERNLRRLLFNTYILNFGFRYYSQTINKEIQDKGKRIIRASGGVTKKEIENAKNFFYALDYGDIQSLLFIPQWTKIEEEAKSNFLGSHSNLSKLSDIELRQAFEKIKPQSDWERFFKDKISDEGVNDKLDDIRKTRNKVAHCKFLNKEEYENCKKSISVLNKEILSAIDLTENEDFINNNLNNLKESIHKINEYITVTVSPAVQAIREVIMNNSYIDVALQNAKKAVLENNHFFIN